VTDNLVLILELIGTVAFSVSGAIVAIRKKMDIFGTMILGLTTAVGGGVIRDLILGITPPTTFRNPVYAVTALITALFVFLPPVRRTLEQNHPTFDRLLLWMDSIGLGIFTVVGERSAMVNCPEGGLFLVLFVGVLTGVGGGVLRDMMAQRMPNIFIKQVYATASLAGAVVCALLWNSERQLGAMLCGSLLVLVLRLCAARFRWDLPRAN